MRHFTNHHFVTRAFLENYRFLTEWHFLAKSLFFGSDNFRWLKKWPLGRSDVLANWRFCQVTYRSDTGVAKWCILAPKVWTNLETVRNSIQNIGWFSCEIEIIPNNTIKDRFQIFSRNRVVICIENRNHLNRSIVSVKNEKLRVNS